MTRSRVLIPTSIWRDPAFNGMTSDAQRTYLLLYTYPARDQAGCVPLTLSRWAGLAHDTTAADIRQSLDTLEDSGFAAVDYDTQEVAVRLLCAPAGHKALQGALADASRILSTRLRSFAIDHLVAAGYDAARGRGSNRPLWTMRATVYRRDGYRCLRCGWAPPSPEGYDGRYALGEITHDATTGQYRVRVLELDHIHPKSLGGPFTMDNLQSLCSSCNASKGARV